MATTVCPFCFQQIDPSHLAYQCTGRGNVECKKEEDENRRRLTRSTLETYPTFTAPEGKTSGPASCPTCGGEANRRACPKCHTSLPIDFVDSKNPMIGLVGAKGSGKTVLMTVLVKQMRDVIGRRYDADIRIATDNPDGHQGAERLPGQPGNAAVQASARCPSAPASWARGRQQATPIVLRWRQETARRLRHLDQVHDALLRRHRG